MLVIIFQLSSCALDQTQTGADTDFMDINVDSDTEQEFRQALIFLKEEKYDDAIDLLKNVVAKEKRLPAPFVNLGMAYTRKDGSEDGGKEDGKLAEKAFMSAIKLDPAHPVANNELGQLYRKAGRFKEAKVVYSNALQKHSDYLPIIKNLGILCELYMRELQCALNQYELYLEQVPDDKTVKAWLVDLKRRMGQ